jgi:hypothetical protein
MKNCFILFFLLASSSVFAQKIDGFYTGILNNDSANKMVQQYELAIAMYKGRITGYSYVTFIVKDTFYYGIRKVKGEIVGDSIVVQDDKFVSNNFPESPAKGVRRTITIPLNGQDSITMLSGSWKTNQTKKYYSVPGTIELVKSKDSSNSPLINHLKELGIVSIENEMVTAAETKTIKAEETENLAASNEITASSTKKKDKKQKDKVKQETTKEETVAKSNASKPDPGSKAEEISKQDMKEMVKAPSSNDASQTEVAQAVHPQSNVTKTSMIQTASKTELPKKPVMPEKPGYLQRSTVVTRAIEVISDSLVLAFYDNGVVDGDSISVYLNGENIVSSTKLTTVATKRTITVAGMDEVRLVLVAENLGSIPPNTGLMSIRDGDNIYQVHFSADMQTNASIIIRRKKN